MQSKLWGNVDSALTALGQRLAVSDQLEVRAGQGLGELLHLEKHWRALVASMPQASFIHAFDWQYAYQQHLEPHPDSIQYFSFFDHDRAVAIFPLRRVRRLVGRILLWLWELPTHAHLVLADPLISPECDVARLIRRLIKMLNTLPYSPWNALHLPNLLEDSLIIRRRLPETLPWAYLEKTGQSMYFECADMVGALARSSSQFKRNLRRQGKKLAQRGVVTFTLARQGEALDAAYADFLRLEASGWKGHGGQASAIALYPRLRDFYGALKERFAASGDCLISLLKLNDVAIAAQFCLLAGGTLYIQKITYDEAFSAEGPGNQLMFKLLEHCCDEPGISQLSLVTGPAWAKGRWNPLSRDVSEVYVFRPGWRGFSGLVMRRFKQQIWAPALAR